MTQHGGFGVVAALVAVFVAACASGSAHPSPTATASPTISASPTPVLTIPIPSPSVSASLPVVKSATTCTGSQLQIAYSPAGSSGGAGSFVLELAVWNHGVQPCQMRGWPSLQFLSRSGGLLPTHEVQTTSPIIGSANPVNIVILPCIPAMSCPPDSFHTAYISFGFDDVLQPCETAASIRVLTPGGSTPVVVDLRVAGSLPDGQVICSDGTIQVLPVHS
jgi:Protein of unknown function (DUF4232)